MTQNQISYAKYKEDKRANQAKEGNEFMANMIRRRANELQDQRQAEERRHNYATENISARQAEIQAQQAQAALQQAATRNLELEQKRAELEEAKRHNLYDESMYGIKYGTNFTKNASYITGDANLPQTVNKSMDMVGDIYHKVHGGAKTHTTNDHSFGGGGDKVYPSRAAYNVDKAIKKYGSAQKDAAEWILNTGYKVVDSAAKKIAQGGKR